MGIPILMDSLGGTQDITRQTIGHLSGFTGFSGFKIADLTN